MIAELEKVAVKGPDALMYTGLQAWRDAVQKTSGFKGLTGTFTCDANGDCADPKIAVYQVTQYNVTRLATPDKPFWRP